jgi:hypothetical protein
MMRSLFSKMLRLLPDREKKFVAWGWVRSATLREKPQPNLKLGWDSRHSLTK